MKKGKLYYLWLYLPDSIKLPKYSRTKKRRREICETILESLQTGEAKLYQAGLDKPNDKVTKVNDEVKGQGFFTSVILKYYTNMKIDLTATDEALINCFMNLFRQSEEVIIIGDNTRMLIDTDKYRMLTLEGRKEWLPHTD